MKNLKNNKDSLKNKFGFLMAFALIFTTSACELPESLTDELSSQEEETTDSTDAIDSEDSEDSEDSDDSEDGEVDTSTVSEDAASESDFTGAEEILPALFAQSAVKLNLETLDSLADGDGTEDCFTSGTVSVTVEEETVDFAECYNAISDYSLLIDGFVAYEVDEQELTLTTAIAIDVETAQYGTVGFEQEGDVAVIFDEPLVTLVFDDFAGSLDNGETQYDYELEGAIDYNADTGLIDGDITISNGEITLTCEFENFDATTAATDDWLDACLP